MEAAVKISREDMSARELRALAGRVKEGRVSRRPPTIALVLAGASRKVTAGSCGMDRQTLRDRVHRCNVEGVEGLFNRGGGGPRRAAGNKWTGLPAACCLPPGATPGVRK